MEQIPSSEEYIQKLIAERKERLKELTCINQTTQIIKESRSVEDALSQIVNILPRAWQYPEMTVARIRFNGNNYTSSGFREGKWKQNQKFETIDNRKGDIEIFYLKEFKEEDEGPFLSEERQLLDNLASIISNYLNSLEASKILQKTVEVSSVKEELIEFQNGASLNDSYSLKRPLMISSYALVISLAITNSLSPKISNISFSVCRNL